MEVKQRLLQVYSTGEYTRLTVPETINLLSITNQFLIQYKDSKLLDKIELFSIYELDFYLLIFTNRDIEAKALCQLIEQELALNEESERLIVLKSYLIESTQGISEAIDYVSKMIEKMCEKSDLQSGNLTNGIIRNKLDFYKLQQRLLIMNHELNQESNAEYIEKLQVLSEVSPLDNELLYQISELYLELKEYDMSLQMLEDILINLPFAYNIFAKIGEVYYMKYVNNNNKNVKDLTTGLKYFLRALELNDEYLRSFVGIYKTIELIRTTKENTEVYDELFKMSELKLKKYQETKEMINSKGLAIIDKIL